MRPNRPERRHGALAGVRVPVSEVELYLLLGWRLLCGPVAMLPPHVAPNGMAAGDKLDGMP